MFPPDDIVQDQLNCLKDRVTALEKAVGRLIAMVNKPAIQPVERNIPTEIEVGTLRQQIVSEYHRLRNVSKKLILLLQNEALNFQVNLNEQRSYERCIDGETDQDALIKYYCEPSADKFGVWGLATVSDGKWSGTPAQITALRDRVVLRLASCKTAANWKDFAETEATKRKKAQGEGNEPWV